MSLFTERKWLAPALVAGAAVVAFLAFGVFGVHTLFIDDEVSEAAPVFATSSDEATDSADGAASDEASADDATDEDATDENAADDAVSDDEADEAMSDDNEVAGDQASDESAPGTAATGTFIDGNHPTNGTAVVLTDGGSQNVLRLEEDFATDNGPDLNVYLASSADGFGEEFIDLGDLKGNIGSQNYELPADVDLGVYDTVVIWCVRFGVGFGSAELA